MRANTRRGEKDALAAFFGVFLVAAFLWAGHAGSLFFKADQTSEILSNTPLSSFLEPAGDQRGSEAAALPSTTLPNPYDGRPGDQLSRDSVGHQSQGAAFRASLSAGGRLPSVVAVLSRYRDDVRWVSSNRSGIMRNSTGEPQFLMPVYIYQASDIGIDGTPTFPSLQLVNTSHPASWPLPGWPDWALPWVKRKNATQDAAPPGSLEDAAREIRIRLGLPLNEFDEEGEAKRAQLGNGDVTHLGNGLPVVPFGKGLPRDTVIDTAYVPGMAIEAPEGASRAPVVSLPKVSPALPLHIVPNRGAEVREGMDV